MAATPFSPAMRIKIMLNKYVMIAFARLLTISEEPLKQDCFKVAP